MKNSITPQEIPIWEKLGDFSCSPYGSSLPLNRRLGFINKSASASASAKIKRIDFLGYNSHHLRVAFEFVSLELCHKFFEILPDKTSTDAFISGESVYFAFSSQKHFDKVFKLFHCLYPLSQEMLSNLPYYLNTRIPKRAT